MFAIQGRSASRPAEQEQAQQQLAHQLRHFSGLRGMAEYQDLIALTSGRMWLASSMPALQALPCRPFKHHPARLSSAQESCAWRAWFAVVGIGRAVGAVHAMPACRVQRQMQRAT